MTSVIYRDAWGIPHLRAATAADAVFAQGYVTALDRAWQLEVERHRALGSSASFLGASALSWDRLVRQARISDTAQQAFAALDEPTAAWVRRYVHGVNAGLAEGASRAPQFGSTGLVPGVWEPWTPLAVWVSHHLLFGGFPTKLWRQGVLERLGPEAVDLFAVEGPAGSGSNGWLVPGSHTASGSALLSGDPHRYVEDPGIYQQVHLSCPELDVVGFAVPGVPGVQHFGHTGGVAWAITNAMADTQDLFAERLRRTASGIEAWGPDGWRPAHAHVEVVDVAGDEPVEVEVIETERGPVVVGGPDAELALSLRYPSRVRRDVGFAALPLLLQARNVDDVDRAWHHWVEPVNVVLAADVSGGLLHRVAGAVPRRARANRVHVVPGWDPEHLWDGWEELPRREVRGITVMANERGLSEPLGHDFAPPHRFRRISALLSERGDWDVDGMPAVLTDTLSDAALPLLDVVRRLDGLAPEVAALRDELLGWDRRMAADSTTAARFAALRSAVVRRLSAHPALAGLGPEPITPEVFLPWLSVPGRIALALPNLLASSLVADMDAVVSRALEEVAATRSSPRWGDVHRLAPWQALPDDPPTPWPGLSGDNDCVLATSSVPGVTDLCLRAPTARYAWDLQDRDASRWVVPLGASGVPGPHQRDQLPLWTDGEWVPVVTDFTTLTKERDVPG